MYPSCKKNMVIYVNNQKNNDINGVYLVVSEGSKTEHWILQKINIAHCNILHTPH